MKSRKQAALFVAETPAPVIPALVALSTGPVGTPVAPAPGEPRSYTYWTTTERGTTEHTRRYIVVPAAPGSVFPTEPCRWCGGMTFHTYADIAYDAALRPYPTHPSLWACSQCCKPLPGRRVAVHTLSETEIASGGMQLTEGA